MFSAAKFLLWATLLVAARGTLKAKSWATGLRVCAHVLSGMGTNSSEQGRTVWARVKGRTENALLRLPFKAAYVFRPGAIIPLHGIRSRTTWYRVLYAVMTPLYLVLRGRFPHAVTTTEQLGRAMLTVPRRGYPKRVLEARDISGL